MIKVSIIVPVYNVEKYLEKCLGSLVHQTLKDIEIIVINDGSPDNSQTIIDNYVKKYPQKIKTFKIKNSGQGEARNVGLLEAIGEYIMYVDSDDYIELNMAEELYNKAKSTKSDIVICGNSIIEDGTYNLIRKESAYYYKERNNDLYNFIFGKMAVWNKMYKKDLITDNNIKFRSKVWYEDLDFTVKAFLNTSKISYIDKPLYNYVLREGSTMNNDNAIRNLELCLAFDEIINYCKKKNIYDKHYDIIEFICIYHMYICGITRIINMNIDKKVRKECIATFKKYLKDNYSDYKNNKYIKKLDINKKIIYNLINLRFFWLIRVIFKIKE